MTDINDLIYKADPDPSDSLVLQESGGATRHTHIEDLPGGGSFPDFTGSGSPEGVQTANVGQSYVDSTNGALYWKKSGASTDTGWILGGGNWVTDQLAGFALALAGTAQMLGTGAANGGGVFGDIIGYLGSSGNSLYWQVTGTDGGQHMLLLLGSSGQFEWDWAADGSTSFPGPIKVDAGASLFSNAGDPNGVVTALATGDVCFDTSTPAIWEAAGAGTVWTQVGSLVKVDTATFPTADPHDDGALFMTGYVAGVTAGTLMVSAG